MGYQLIYTRSTTMDATYSSDEGNMDVNSPAGSLFSGCSQYDQCDTHDDSLMSEGELVRSQLDTQNAVRPYSPDGVERLGNENRRDYADSRGSDKDNNGFSDGRLALEADHWVRNNYRHGGDRDAEPHRFDNNSPNPRSSTGPDELQALEDSEGIDTLSLAAYVRRAKDLLEADCNPDFCKFVLNGLDGGRQCRLDRIQNTMDHGHSVNVTHDYDSLLGLSTNLPLDTAVTISPICKIEDTLQKNIHIKYSFTNNHACIAIPMPLYLY